MITRERLKLLLTYDAETGIFRRRKNDQIAGGINKNGYVVILCDGVHYYGHRLAWLYMVGEIPTQVDHKNCVKNDNKWGNLRRANYRINRENRRTPTKGNKLGLLGVAPNGSGFRATITVNGKQRHLGTFATPEEASQKYIDAKRIFHEGCTI